MSLISIIRPAYGFLMWRVLLAVALSLLAPLPTSAGGIDTSATVGAAALEFQREQRHREQLYRLEQKRLDVLERHLDAQERALDGERRRQEERSKALRRETELELRALAMKLCAQSHPGGSEAFFACIESLTK